MAAGGQISWGIIGCGNVTEFKSGPALQKIGHSSVSAVMRRTPGMARDYARRHGIQNYYTQARELIRDPQVNAVYIATPPSSHKKYTIQALQAGKPVYVEKPMALNYSECREMINVSRKTQIPLFVAYYRRSLPSFLKVKTLIDTGEIGRIRHVFLQLYRSVMEPDPSGGEKLPWRLNPRISGGGLLHDLGSHQINFLHYLFGKAQTISALAWNQSKWHQVEDSAALSIIFQTGVFCTCAWSFNIPKNHQKDTIEIYGDLGKIEMSTFGFSPVKVYSTEGLKQYEFSKPKHVQEAHLQAVVNELRGLGRCPGTMETAAYTTLILDQIKEKLQFPKGIPKPQAGY